MPEAYNERQKDFQTIKRAIEKKISDLRIFLSTNQAQFRTIEEKLQSPYRRKNVELVVHCILQRNLEMLNELKKASQTVLKNVDALRNKLTVREELKTIFTAKEVRDNLARQYRSLKEKHEEAVAQHFHLRRRRVTARKALNKAKNIFVHGDFKKLSTKQTAYKKELAKYERDKSEYQKHEMEFIDTNWANHAQKFQAQYYLTKEKIRLEEFAKNLSKTKIQLDSELTRLETLCRTEDATEKIALLAASILRKNLKIAQEYEVAKKLVKDLSQELQRAEKRFNVIDKNLYSLNPNFLYRVIHIEGNREKTKIVNENKMTKIIADALIGEPYAVSLVARSSGNNLEMDKSWELLSELDKDEFIRQKIVRQL